MESDHLVEGDVEEPSTDYNALFGENEKRRFTQKTVIGEVRNWKRFSWLEWIFIAVASVSILGVLGMTIERFVFFETHFRNISVNVSNGSQHMDNLQLYHCNNWTCTNDFILTVVVIVNLVFCAVYVTDGLLREKMFEIVGYCVAIAGIMVYIIANYGIKKEDGQVLKLVRLILVVVGGPINIILASIVSYKMGYFVFSTVGSNNSLIRAYKIRSFLLTLQYFLLQVMANALTLAWVRDGDLVTTAEKVILCLLLVYSFIVMLCGWTAVMFENKWVALVWHFLLSPYYAYFTYKIVNVGVQFDKVYKKGFYICDPHCKYVTFEYIGVSVIVLCGLGLIVMVLLNTFMLLSQWNFRKGLKDKVPPPTDVWLGLYHSSVALLKRERQAPAAASS